MENKFDILELEKIRNNQSIFKNYKFLFENKVNEVDCVSADDLNKMIILLNWCFFMHNNFFIQNFNGKTLKNVQSLYAQLKNNIFDTNNRDIFYNLHINELKLLKYIFIQYISMFDQLTDDVNTILTEQVDMESIKHCIVKINNYIRKNYDETSAPY